MPLVTRNPPNHTTLAQWHPSLWHCPSAVCNGHGPIKWLHQIYTINHFILGTFICEASDKIYTLNGPISVCCLVSVSPLYMWWLDDDEHRQNKTAVEQLLKGSSLQWCRTSGCDCECDDCGAGCTHACHACRYRAKGYNVEISWLWWRTSAQQRGWRNS